MENSNVSIGIIVVSSQNPAEDGDNTEPIPISLVKGSNVLGREGLTKITDKKLSRRQLEIIVDGETVKAKLIGMNPSTIYKISDNNLVSTIIMNKDEEYILNHHDRFSLLPSTYFYRLNIESAKSSTPSKVTGVRKTPPKDEEIIPTKRLKIEPVITSPIPDGIDKKKIEMRIQLREMFSDATSDLINKAVLLNNTIESAIEYIFNPPPDAIESMKEIVKEDIKMKDTSKIVTPTVVTMVVEKPVEVESTPAMNRNDSGLARELQQAYEIGEERKKIDQEKKTQAEIISLLMKDAEEEKKKTAELTSKLSIDTDKLYLPGEKEAIAGTAIKTYELLPSREFEDSAEQVHFRTAESQFHRLSAGSSYKVTKVEYIVNPPLVKQFQQRRLKLAEHMEWNDTRPILAFHGTSETAIDNIVKNNFDFSKIGASTGNMGYYGKGIYFSEYPGYSMGYVRGGNKILLCLILIGNSYKTAYNVGCTLKDGYDSHISTDGNEIVIFQPDAILPCYVVHYTSPSSPYGATSLFTTTMFPTPKKKKKSITVVANIIMDITMKNLMSAMLKKKVTFPMMVNVYL